MTAPLKLVILDRDGVINVDSDHFIKSPAEWKALPGSVEAIARLNQSDFRVVVATNQSGIGRGLFDMATLNAINDKMMQQVFRAGGRIDAIFFCPCTAEQHCHCRKPDTGMFEEIAARYQIGLAGANTGCLPILVLTGKGKMTRVGGGLPPGTRVFADLSAAADALIAESARAAA